MTSPRRARIDEAGDIADCWLRARAASVPVIPPPVHRDAEVRAWFQAVVVPKREVWVTEVEEAAVALLVLDGGWVDQLYVDPAHIGRGFGTELLNLAKSRRPAGLQLWTFEANIGAHRFYERHGFVRTAATTGDNEEGAPDVRFGWGPTAQRAHGARSSPSERNG